MTNEGEVYFMLHGGDFDPDEVTRFIGLQPTSVRRKANPKPKFSTWEVSSGKVQSDIVDVYQLSSELISLLKPYTQKISEIKKRLEIQAVLEVVLRITTDDSISTPAIGFESEVISFLNEVGATIDVDTYRNLP